MDNRDLLWKLFEATGNISYYLLYKRVEKNERS